MNTTTDRNIWFYDFPIGTLGIAEENGGISRICFGEHLAGFETAETPLIQRAAEQLREYFNEERRQFALPLSLRGTAFQLAVWNALRTIHAGETRSYRDVAVMVGNPKACRAVGLANNRNPIPIFIPCHRVIGSNGSLTGYAGGLWMKQYLLELEGAGSPEP